MYRNTETKSLRDRMGLEKNLSPHTWPQLPMSRLKAMANTPSSHCMIFDKDSFRPGLRIRCIWFPIKQKFSTEKWYFIFALVKVRMNKRLISAGSKCIKRLFVRAVMWYRAPCIRTLAQRMPDILRISVFASSLEGESLRKGGQTYQRPKRDKKGTASYRGGSCWIPSCPKAYCFLVFPVWFN
jgi:hypothetical protein